jgi:two-component system, sporulation sensor kinase E
MSIRIPEKIKILYIEDDKDSALTTMKYLEEATISKFEIVHMGTLKDGLDYLETKCKMEENCGVDVILLDLILPNSKGIDTYKSVVDKCPFIPVVIVSGHEEMAIECVRLGAQDYLYKPDYNGGTLTRSLTYAVQRDYITKKYERERHISQLYLDVAGVIILILNPDQTIEMINKKGCEILGYSESEIIGMNWFDNFIPEDRRDEIKSVFDKIIAGELETVEFYTNPIRVKDGSERYISWRNSIRKNSDGKIINILSSGEDITKIREKEEQYRHLVEFTKAGIYKIDFVNNKFCYVNHVLCEQLGYTKEELMRLGPHDILTKESIERWIERWEALKRGEWVENSFEYEAVRKDGSHVWALITAEYIEDSNKNIIGANVVAIDITEKKIAQEEAKRKEEMIFSELENRIHRWKEDLIAKPTMDRELHEINLNIMSMTNKSEVP